MLKGPDADGITSVEQLQGLRLGAQTGTTSLTAIRDVIQPDSDPIVFKDTSAAKQALLNDQVDAILADLPTAFYITAVEIPKGTIVGQFQPEPGQEEEFGMLFEKGSPLVECVNQALSVAARGRHPRLASSSAGSATRSTSRAHPVADAREASPAGHRAPGRSSETRSAVGCDAARRPSRPSRRWWCSACCSSAS